MEDELATRGCSGTMCLSMGATVWSSDAPRHRLVLGFCQVICRVLLSKLRESPYSIRKVSYYTGTTSDFEAMEG